jgi:putative FmdB family regulatory protein
MPTYEFECNNCNHNFEKIMRMTLAAKTAKCPCCGKRAKRLLSVGSGFILKGKGWPGKEIKNGNRKSNTT